MANKGLLALGAYTNPDGLDSKTAQRDLETAKALTYTCYQMYARTKTGLSSEAVNFHNSDGNTDFVPATNARFYVLRPEVVESIYILSVLTGDPIYREWGWEIFQAIEHFCRTDVGYGSSPDVDEINLLPDDRMESFFLAETLKYLYLIQDPDSTLDILNSVSHTAIQYLLCLVKYLLLTNLLPLSSMSSTLRRTLLRFCIMLRKSRYSAVMINLTDMH